MGKLPAAVAQLVQTFAEHAEHYTSSAYNETLCRIEFINPLFAALGWDVENKKGYADAYREVYHEDAVKIGSATKAPDYSFRIGGQRKFFLEAKKPGVNLKNDPVPAYQLRRYGWSAKLPLCVLTDFEEFAVYDTRIEPSVKDKASDARIFYCRYDELEEHWEWLVATFSPEAIQKGSFDKYAAGAKGKRGTAEVDVAFLREIEAWRETLAKAFAKENTLSQRDLNFAVQRTIDRIIFLRICEDRGIEPYGQLVALSNGDAIYARLCELFRRGDEKYNSGIFHFHKEAERHEAPDELTPGLAIDDKPLRDILRNLYYPHSPYEFSVITADILGQVYEQFLGKVIRLTSEHRAVVEEKPEVRKAGGVYYTPTYIVDYIVQSTVGKLLEGKTPKEAAKLKILDPACGSGSFLIGAYQHLLNWHAAWYAANDPQKHATGKHPAVYQGKGGAWRLTMGQRKAILLNNIYGVDIDPQAVETTKLSLLLKVLEGESQETLDNQMKLFRERALPDLGDNIKCGNSLIGSDFYDNQQMMLLGEEEKLRVNVFDWEREFGGILGGGKGKKREGGFDAVIGNPPYVRMESFKEIKDYLRAHYASHAERADLYAYFLERGVHLARPGGLLGEIVSNKFLKAKYGFGLREFLAGQFKVSTVADFAGADVFESATVRTIVLIGTKGGDQGFSGVKYVPVPTPGTLAGIKAGAVTVAEYAAQTSVCVPSKSLGKEGWQFSSLGQSAVLERMRKSGRTLKDFVGARALFGVKTGLNEAFIVDAEVRKRIEAADLKSKKAFQRILFGKDIRRYSIRDAGRSVIYCHPDRDIGDFPAIRKVLEPHRKALENRAGPQKWFELQQPAVALLPFTTRPKIVYPIIANECRFMIERRGFLVNDKAFILPTDNKALLGILNSKLANFYFGSVCAALEGSRDRYLEFRAQYVDPFPLPAGFKGDEARLVSHVTQMLSLHESLGAAKTPHVQESLRRQIGALDEKIDAAVYELYGLTDAEIAVVEGATGG